MISSWLPAGAIALAMAAASRAAPDFRVQLETVTSGYDGKTCWAQARAGAIPRPGQPPIVVITMNKLIVTGSDVYLPIHDMRTDDLGKTWSPPRAHEATLGRRKEAGGLEVGISDFWPKYHAESGRLLGMGQTFRYRGERRPEAGSGREVIYSAYDPDTRAWDAWAVLDLGGTDMAAHAGAGSAQRLDLPNGELLLPIYFTPPGEKFSRVRVLRCSYDGKTLRRIAHGNALTLESKRGFAEPSLAYFRGKYFLAIRHDDAAHVATSDDGLNFGAPQLWRWDDGELLGSYNTQTHWVTHDDGLFLVYTRRGANNDHVFRHRAPLFIAEVDLATLRVRRATEHVLIPERGARYGNFGVCDVNENETWVVETEWMQKPGPEFVIPVDNPGGAAARVYAARILWERPNTGWGR